MDQKFSAQIERLVHELVSIPVEDFNLTTKLNRAANFQVYLILFNQQFVAFPPRFMPVHLKFYRLS